MSQEQPRRRVRRARQRQWDQPEQGTPDTQQPYTDPFDAPMQTDKDTQSYAPSPNPMPPSDEPEQDAPPEQKTLFTRENITLMCILAAAFAIAAIFGVLLFTQSAQEQSGAGVTATQIPYDVTQPFMPSDITQEQMALIEQNAGSVALLDYQTGPHGIKLGDTLDTLLQRFPVTYTQTVEDDYAWDDVSQDMSYLAYDLLENDYQVIYAERVFYQEGEMVVLPPSGTLSISSDMIVVTLTAPLTPYPEGTAEDYLSYPHVYCKLTVDPDLGTITRIVLGKTE